MKTFDEFINESENTIEAVRKVDKAFFAGLPADVIEMTNIFKKSRQELFVVGGAIRDHLNKKTPHDYDLATGATPAQVRNIMSPYATVTDEGTEQGVSFVYFGEEKELYEIATFQTRLNDTRKPGAVTFSTILKDFQRRDLTMNALYYDISSKEIIDYVGGIDDIKNSIVRTVGEAAARFKEDKLRKLRAVRFTDKTGSILNPDIIKAFIADNTLGHSSEELLDGVSMERRIAEFTKGVESARNLVDYLTTLDKYGFLDQVILGANIPNPSKFKKLKTKYAYGIIAFLLSETPFKGKNDLYKYLALDMKIEGKEFSNLIVFLYTAIRKDFPMMVETIGLLDFVKSEIPKVKEFLKLFYTPKQVNHILSFDIKKEKKAAHNAVKGKVQGKEMGIAIKRILLQKLKADI